MGFCGLMTRNISMSLPVFTARSIEAASNSGRRRGCPTLRKLSPSDYFRRAHPTLPHRADRQRSIALGKTASSSVGHQLVVTVAWRRQVQQRLQNAVDMRRSRQIFTAGHESNSLDRIVYSDGEVIARRHVLACENDIA